MKQNRFHACATCIHFLAEKTEQGMSYYCQRLGYQTKPNYTFNCWNPKEHIKKLIDKERRESC
ncbi:hypothetical protein ACQKP0_06830 [Heyndrickxia sp. NPDC080065]|uniref:hypothetical protein n=1 Tax=Heyndrickxia sp. NPDC080065 TaxID=3390568 RepID=UPI003D03EDA7